MATAVKSPPKIEEMIGEVARITWSSDDGEYVIGKLANNIGIKGNPPSSGLTPGLTYRFGGKWLPEDSKWGRQFEFRFAVEHLPANRHGVVEYLKRYAPGVGQSVAQQLCDEYGPADAVAALKRDPNGCALRVRGLSTDKAHQAAEALIAAEKFQETRIRLLELVANKGFGEKAIDACIEQWGVSAPDVVHKDPFKMMVAGVFGAGFMRCDRLWHEFGLPLDKMRRQVMAAWDHMRSDMSGSTWHEKSAVIDCVKRLITGNARPDRAVAIAVRAGVLKQRERDGKLWLAERDKAEQEDVIADKIGELL